MVISSLMARTSIQICLSCGPSKCDVAAPISVATALLTCVCRGRKCRSVREYCLGHSPFIGRACEFYVNFLLVHHRNRSRGESRGRTLASCQQTCFSHEKCCVVNEFMLMSCCLGDFPAVRKREYSFISGNLCILLGRGHF